jgi:hypothetical protein
MVRWLWLVLALAPAIARADDKRCIDVQFTPTDALQVVAWLETPAGDYVDTLFVTQQIGTFGLGNRPGRFDFNSGPAWPYGRRITTFPVWSHKHGKQFPYVMFQNDNDEQNVPFQDPDFCFTADQSFYKGCGENNLSHPFNHSTRELHYCKPLMKGEPSWDTGTCATTVFTDKGRFSTDMAKLSGYPPRTDLTRVTNDSPSVDMFKMMNPFDAVSQPTPVGGALAHAAWPVPADLPPGDYVMFVETAKEFDFNATYNAMSYPAPPDISWMEYGMPYRGQPSVVYRVPFTIATSQTSASSQGYIGYGDPAGADGAIRPPDTTITTDTPGSGGSRLELVSDDSGMYRVRVVVSPNVAADLPGAPEQLQSLAITGSGNTLGFYAPGIGPQHLRATGYEIRVRANDEMTPDNFADSMPVTTHVMPDDAGTFQTFDLAGLLPETDYWVGIRAFDGCHNTGDLAIQKFTTLNRASGAVDACFVATAAYGSVMANDVELLRHFRDSLLETNVLGELGVEAYYTFGPAVAGTIGESDLLRASARDALAPVIARVRRLAF